MKFDPATESIAHFIGLFELAVEEQRLRQDYLEFELRREAPENLVPIEPIGVKLQAPYQLGDFSPALAYRIDLPAAARLDHAWASAETGDWAAAIGNWTAEALEAPSIMGGRSVILQSAPAPETFGFPVFAPGGIVAVTVQVAILSDNDLFLNGPGAAFTDPADLQKTLDAMVAVADDLAAFDAPHMPTEGDWPRLAEEFLAQLDTAPAADGVAQVATLRGEEADGVFVNGAPVQEAPEWTDLLPAYLRPVDDEAGTGAVEKESADGETVALLRDGVVGEGVRTKPAEHDFSRDFKDYAPASDTMEPGRTIVAGANKAVNEIALGSNWVDAPVIVVQGDVAKFDAISQVNLLVEHDRIDGVPVGQSSAGHNIAEIITQSSKAPDAPPASEVRPVDWQVVRTEADLLQVNWVKQFTYATDLDRAEVTFSASATFLGLGENQIVNSTILNEFGYAYDLIFVAGDMIDATIVSQTNVLFDSDEVVTGLAGPVATTSASAPASAPANGTAGALTAQPDLPPSRGSEEPAEWDDDGIVAAPGTVEITSAVDMDLVRETSAGPAPVEDAVAAGEAEEPSSAPEPALSLADNLLLNKATIEETGVDSFVEMKESFAAAAKSLAEGAGTIAREVAQDTLFAGKEALRVLQVDGDLVKLNVFEQMNILGDADQLRLDLETLRDRIESEMKLIAGSNALVNLATVTDYGVDSTVMAAGHVYDDAFIHQAELFDTEAAPTGVAMAGLANEAIAAFLSDDMLAAGEVAQHVAPTGIHEGFAHLDVMQTAVS